MRTCTWLTGWRHKTNPLMYNTADSRFRNEAMADRFLRFLEGYIKAENVKSDAIHGEFPLVWICISHFWEKRLEKKKLKFRRSSTLTSVTHWLKNTVGSHEINRLIFERPANNPKGDAKTVTSSHSPAYRGTKLKCIWGESPRKSPAKARMGGAGVSNDWCIITLIQHLSAAQQTEEKVYVETDSL